MKLLVKLTAALGLSVLSLCSAAPAPAKKPPAVTKSDAAIEQELKSRLSRSKLAASKFGFRVQSGVVTWTGKTDIIQHKGAATRMAKAAGARQVVNQIEISETARRKAADRLMRSRKTGQPKKAQVTRAG